jgi:hypothetical protein
MKIKRGWATDFGKVRFDVEVDEYDLRRMLAARGIEDPEALSATMRTADVEAIMDAEAMTFVHMSLAKQEPGSKDAHEKKAAEYRAERNRVLDKYAPKP